jgi:polyisoprenyl-teichoic acid--peptidoglycan teichoic acid transferase
VRPLRPRSTAGLVGRFLSFAVIVVGAAAATTAVAGLLQVNTIVQILSVHPGVNVKQVKLPPAGAPETILLIGSDHRASDRSFRQSNTDTMLLVRLNADSSTINLFSIPRDLYVDVPGHGMEKINAAYSEGGYGLLIRTIQADVFPKFVPNHIIDVNFQGFSDLVDAIGCVYSDVDRRYYNVSSGLEGDPDDYSSINIQPGYQKLCGHNQSVSGALPFVRYRHTDTDLVREARQQDFLRWAKEQYPLSQALSNRNHLLKVLAEHATFDRGLQSTHGVLSLADLLLNLDSATIKQITFPATYVSCTIDGVTEQCIAPTSRATVRHRWQQFMTATKKGAPSKSSGNHAHRRPRAASTAGLVAGVTYGRQQAAALAGAGMPVYFPRLVRPTQGTNNSSTDPYCYAPAANCNNGFEPATAYAHSYPRRYRIIDRDGHAHPAYRMTLVLNYELGQFYGVQGTTWDDPPLLASPSGTTTVDGRKLFLYADGHRLTTVAWHHDGDAYWISNTLTSSIPNRQMIAIAASLTRDGR